MRTGSMPSTTHCEPNARAPSAMIAGFATAREFTLTFSAPARRIFSMSATDDTPPPTANGMRTARATRATISRSVGRRSCDAVMS